MKIKWEQKSHWRNELLQVTAPLVDRCHQSTKGAIHKVRQAEFLTFDAPSRCHKTVTNLWPHQKYMSQVNVPQTEQDLCGPTN